MASARVLVRLHWMRRYAPAQTVTALSLLLASPAVGSLQEASTTEGADDATSREIIVTARRESEPLARSAVPVSVIDGKELQRRGLSRLPSLQDEFPALEISPTSTGNLVFIRGVGNFTLLPNSDPAAAIAYDGVFVARPAGTTTQFFDIDRVELLKGPQGVLYGRNASAGSINIEPKLPVIGKDTALAHLTLGSDGQRRFEGAANLSLGVRSAARLSGLLSSQNHLIAGFSEGQSEQSLRAQIKTSLGSTSFRIAADHSNVTGVGIGTAYLGNYVYSPATGSYRFFDAPVSLSDSLYTEGSQAYRQTIFLAAAGRNLDAIGSRPRQRNSFVGIHSHIESEFPFGKVTIIPAWRRSRMDVVAPGPPFGLAQDDDLSQLSLEARLSGRNDSLEWLAGTFLFREAIDSFSATNLSSSLILTDQSYRTHSAALFGHLTLHATETLRIAGGARFTRDRKSFASDSDSLAIICQQRVENRPFCPAVPLFPLARSVAEVPFALPSSPGNSRPPILAGGVPTGAVSNWSNRVDSNRLIDKAVTWRLSADADLGPRTLLYGSVETGYRPGGFNAATGFETFEPERITAYTIGLRHRNRDQSWRVDLEAFWWNYRDQQVSSLRPDLSSVPRNANITDNIASSQIRGIEADMSFRPFKSTEVRGVIHYLDAEYRAFRYLQANTGVPPLTGCAAALSQTTNLYEVDCSSQRPYNSPRWSLLLSASQEMQLGSWTLRASANTRFRTTRNIGFAFLPQQRINSHWRSNLQLTAAHSAGKVELGLLFSNLENERVPDFVIFHPVSNAVVAGSSPPFSWGLWLLTRF